MATLVLGAIGAWFGGPLGGAIGALAGRQVDSLIFRPSGREGRRLKDLSISTSSYGQPIPQVFGTARVAGTIFWATDLAESRSSSGGGKGAPKVTSFSYSTSLAVAVSSRPIVRIGRIWADGQLLRGAAGDLKVGGSVRVYTGAADQPVDPLLAGAAGGNSPAYRGCAYVVFEGLQLAEYGNRIPALSFEVIADEQALDLADLVHGQAGLDLVSRGLPGLGGFEFAGESLRDAFAGIDALYPVAVDIADAGLVVAARPDLAAPRRNLPDLLASSDDNDFGQQSGTALTRHGSSLRLPGALRHYDPARDYQPGVQRGTGDHADDAPMLEFPGVLAAGTARELLEAARLRAGASATGRRVRTGTIDPAIAPGTVVTLPDSPGAWLVVDWEWRESGIELSLERIRRQRPQGAASDPGQFAPPADLTTPVSVLFAFELPLDNLAATDSPRRFIAASADGAGWQGAELLADSGSGYAPVGASGRARATLGRLSAELGTSPALVIERAASIEVDLLAADMMLAPATDRALAFGANRLLIGEEILQFLDPVPLGNGRWRLDGLLRGRGGTERAALQGHPAGTPVILLDESLIAVEQLSPAAATASTFAAIGLADPEPAVAPLAGTGTSLTPLQPVHPRSRLLANGDLQLAWTRRARGAWYWVDHVDVPLVEQFERYQIGAGTVDQPSREWAATTPEILLSPTDLGDLPPGTPLWVRQVGSHALSPPLLLDTIQ